MAHKQVALDTAAFLDSPEAQALTEPSRAEVKKIAEIFLGLCYDALGKKPRLLDGQDMHMLLGHQMPGRLALKDPLAEHVPAILEAYIDHLEATQVVTDVFEMRRGLQGTIGEFREAVRTGQDVHHHAAPRQDPFVHRAAKLGRNDPCSCGSGKKFKKCHGKQA
jgi:hypothetical protein